MFINYLEHDNEAENFERGVATTKNILSPKNKINKNKQQQQQQNRTVNRVLVLIDARISITRVSSISMHSNRGDGTDCFHNRISRALTERLCR